MRNSGLLWKCISEWTGTASAFPTGRFLLHWGWNSRKWPAWSAGLSGSSFSGTDVRDCRSRCKQEISLTVEKRAVHASSPFSLKNKALSLQPCCGCAPDRLDSNRPISVWQTNLWKTAVCAFTFTGISVRKRIMHYINFFLCSLYKKTVMMRSLHNSLLL